MTVFVVDLGIAMSGFRGFSNARRAPYPHTSDVGGVGGRQAQVRFNSWVLLFGASRTIRVIDSKQEHGMLIRFSPLHCGTSSPFVLYLLSRVEPGLQQL